jgi:hypothetical protein
MNNESSIVVHPKTQFIDNVKKWVLIDSQIKLVNEKMKQLRNMKSETLSEIITFAKENHIDHKKIEITDGELRFYEKKEYQPITFHFLEEHLAKIIKNKDQIDSIIQFLKESREITTSTDIRRTYNKCSSV